MSECRRKTGRQRLCSVGSSIMATIKHHDSAYISAVILGGMRLLTDITPLRASPAFRRLWIGSTLSLVGTSMTSFAIMLEVYDATHSTAATGAIGLVTLIPMLLIALPGGTLADRVDKRKLVLVMTAGQTGVSALLFGQALLGHGAGLLWLVYALVAVQSAVAAVNTPARRTLLPALVPSTQLP